jgi:hypothetical protein
MHSHCHDDVNSILNTLEEFLTIFLVAEYRAPLWRIQKKQVREGTRLQYRYQYQSLNWYFTRGALPVPIPTVPVPESINTSQEMRIQYRYQSICHKRCDTSPDSSTTSPWIDTSQEVRYDIIHDTSQDVQTKWYQILITTTTTTTITITTSTTTITCYHRHRCFLYLISTPHPNILFHWTAFNRIPVMAPILAPILGSFL